MNESTPALRRRTWLLAGVILFLVGASVGVWWGYRVWERGRVLQIAEAGDFERAGPLLERELARSPWNLDVIQALARGYLAREERSAALPVLDRWCALRPNDPEPFRLRLDAHQKEQRYEAAREDARQLAQLVPEDPKMPLMVASLSFSAGNLESAERDCRAVLKLQPRRRDARRLLAEILRAQGKYDAAAKVLDALLAEKGDDTAVLLGRGSLYVERGEGKKAIPLLEQVLRLDPRRQRTGRYQLVLAYEQAGRAEDVRRVQAELHALQEAEVLSDALGSQPENVEVQVRAARAWLMGPRVAQGLELLGRILERHPEHGGAHTALAEYFERIGQADRAAEHRRRAGSP